MCLLCASLSQENFITPTVFGEIIYENFLFDIPKILDLCVLFGKGNSQLLHKMIGELCVLSLSPQRFVDADCTMRLGYVVKTNLTFYNDVLQRTSLLSSRLTTVTWMRRCPLCYR